MVDESLGDTLWVTVVATGFDATSEEVLTEQVETATMHHRPNERLTSTLTGRAYGSTGTVNTSGAASRETSRGGQKGSEAADDELEIPPFLT